ncbi:MAG: AraC family transcriptional regulator, partial [Bacteroidota bacterium]
MNANYQKLSLDLSKNLFMDFWVKSDFFGFHWHYHPEIEICYVKKGFGQRIVGESVERFVAGDLVLVGSNLPHCWISDQVFNESPEQMEVYVVHVDIGKMGHLLKLHEFAELENFLVKAGSGFHFEEAEEEGILKVLGEFEHSQGLEKTLLLLTFFEKMLRSSAKRQLCKSTYVPETGKEVEGRILSVCRYIHTHYKEKIRLDELASLAHMNTSAFCRFFKKVLGKTAIEYINELR